MEISTLTQKQFDKLSTKRKKNIYLPNGTYKTLEQIPAKIKTNKLQSLEDNQVSIYNKSITSDLYGFHDVTVVNQVVCGCKQILICFDAAKKALQAFCIEADNKVRCLTLSITQDTLQRLVSLQENNTFTCPEQQVYHKSSIALATALYESV